MPGPRPDGVPVTPQSRQGAAALQPLGSLASIYSWFLVLGLVVAGWTFRDQLLGSKAGVSSGRACAQTGINALATGTREWTTRPGTSLTPHGTLQACILHPAAGQWALQVLTWLPGLLLWCAVLAMILRLVRSAAARGPFTPAAAAMMAQLGWVILAGSVLAAALSQLGAQVLTNMVITPGPFDTGTIAVGALVTGPLQALLPVPALAGTGLVSFAGLIRAAAMMDEEIRATV